MKQKKRLRRKVISYVLALVMVISTMTGIVPGMSLTAYAAGVSYVDGSGTSQTVEATELEAATTNWTNGSWYIVPEGGLTISGRIAVGGTVNLILRDGAELTASAGITVTVGNTLNIYAQSAGTGALSARGANGGDATNGGHAGIGSLGPGGYASAANCGTINIYGGTITATGGNGNIGTGGGAGIGGGGLGWKSTGGGGCGAVSIYGGTVTATGGNAGEDSSGGAGIGGGGNGYDTSTPANGTLTLGKGVKLYNGTDNTGTVLDDSDSAERSYSGSRPKNMFAEGPDFVSHTHSFTYTADGATITATCTADGCTLDDGQGNHTATLTIAAPALTTYGGTESADAVITDESGIQGTAVVSYYKATKSGNTYTKGDGLTGTPTDAGDYIAEITLGTAGNLATAFVGYTIAKANPTATVPSATATYGQTLANVTLANPEGNTQGEWSWVNPGTTSVGDAGDNTFKANFTPEDANNYNTVNNVDVIVTVGKAAAPDANTITDAQKPTAKTGDDVVYTGIAIPLVTAPASFPAGYTGVQYSTDGGQTWSSEIPTRTNAGDYTVKVKYTSNNYADLAGEDVAVTITQATAPDASTITDAQKPAAKTGDDVVYTGQPIALVTAPSSLPTGYTGVQYSTDGGQTWSSEIPIGTNADDYTVKVKYTSNNYADLAGSDIAVTITKAAAPDANTITDAQKPAAKTGDDVVYTGNAIPLVTAPASFPAGYTGVQYSTDDGQTWSTEVPTGVDAGDYTVKVKYTSNNYEDLAGGDVNVTLARTYAIPATVTANNRTYDGTEKPLLNADTSTLVGGTMYYALGTDAATAPGEDQFAISIPEKADAGTYYVWYKVVGDTNYIDTQPTCVNAKIDPVAKTDLNKAILEAETYYNSIKNNTSYSKVATALKSAIDAAKIVAANDNADEALISSNKTALAQAKATAEKGKKEVDDTIAAQTASDKINTLPSSDKVAVTDKASIEATRKAYDALSAEQKAKVDSSTLKKLTDAESALAAAEKAAKDTAALEAVKKEAYAAMSDSVKVTQKGKKLQVKWKKCTAADGYDVYVGYCGKGNKKSVTNISKNTTTKVSISKVNGKKLNLKKNMNVCVQAYKMVDGKKVVLAKSMIAHVVGNKNAKYTNVKSLKLKKTKYTVGVGKTAKVKATVKLVDKNKKHIPKGHGAKLRYRSLDESIATVDKKGNIKGVAKGETTVVVYSINGIAKKAKVTVK